MEHPLTPQQLRLLSNTDLFRGLSPGEVEGALACLGSRHRTVERGVHIYSAGERMDAFGLVLRGYVSVEHNDFWGNKSILSKVGPGQIFGETYACIPGEPLLVDVVAQETVEVLFFPAEKILVLCDRACQIHRTLVSNLLLISAQKNLGLSRKIAHTTAKSIRGRLLSYLSDQASRQGSHSFTVPFDRQQLADYLNVDRSALSNELGKMQREGLLQVRRSHFVLNRTGTLEV